MKEASVTDFSLDLALKERRARLLVVDDQAVNIQTVYQLFADTHDVFMAMNGAQALEFCLKTPPDLVLLDVNMPSLDGLEVCRQLKSNLETREIPVLFVTASDHPEEETACWEAGGVDFVSKPFNHTTLRNRVRAHLALKFQADFLREMAFVDGLTGVSNRRLFDERLDAEWRRSLRNQRPLSVIMVDVDFFKRYNDQYGHLIGDECLRRIASALKSTLKRPQDLVARFGGEEFVCLLPETEFAAAMNVASLLADAIQNLGIAHAYSDCASIITISMGVSAATPAYVSGSAAMLQIADEQLYRAKQQGRSRVCGVAMDNNERI